MNAWVLLFIAIAVEVFGTTALKLSDGFRKLPWVVAVAASYGFAFFALSVAVRAIPLGLAYAMWAGLGTVGAFIVGWLVFGEPVSVLRFSGAALVIVGVALLNMGGAAH